MFGLADERFGEVPGAVVKYRPGAALTSEQLCAYLYAAYRRVQGAAADLDL